MIPLASDFDLISPVLVSDAFSADCTISRVLDARSNRSLLSHILNIKYTHRARFNKLLSVSTFDGLCDRDLGKKLI
jgi:hypothetical protein